MTTNQVDPKKLPSQDRSKKRVALILEATVSLLEKFGVESITPINISKEARITTASFYRYFPNKIAVMNVLFQQYLKEVTDRMDRLEAELLHKVGWRDFFMELPIHLLATPCFSVEADSQLLRAMEFFPSLQPLAEEHSNNVATRLVRYLKAYGCRWEDGQLLDLAIYLNRSSNSLFRASLDADSQRQQQFLDWSYEIIQTLLEQCFDDQAS